VASLWITDETTDGADDAGKTQAERSRHRHAVLAIVVAACVTVLVGTWLLSARSQKGGGGNQLMLCQGITSVGASQKVRNEQEALRECDRAARDRARRLSLPTGQQAHAEAADNKIARLAVTGGSCQEGICPAWYHRHPPTQQDVAVLHAALTDAGFPDNNVRLARGDDPAPTGALLYAVRVDSACIVGYLETVGAAPAHWIGGLLPDGRCLGG
jgi:hypothetical protein